MKRRALLWVLAILSGAGVLFAGYAGKRTLDPSERSMADAYRSLDISGLHAGEFRQFRTRKGPIFVYKPTRQNWIDLQNAEPGTNGAIDGRFISKSGVFVYFGISTRLGCELTHRPPTSAPQQDLPARWAGGYVDTCHGPLFDYAGRHISGAKELPQLLPVNATDATADEVVVDLRGES